MFGLAVLHTALCGPPVLQPKSLFLMLTSTEMMYISTTTATSTLIIISTTSKRLFSVQYMLQRSMLSLVNMPLQVA